MIKFVVLAVIVTMVSCQYGHAPAYNHGAEGQDEYAAPHYSFEYSVHDPHTGDIKGQKEQREGDNTQGEYYLVEPDGSRRNVQYHVEGKSGFIAEVNREQGKGSYEQPRSSYNQPRPSYNQPRSSYNQPRPSYNQPRQSYNQQPYNRY